MCRWFLTPSGLLLSFQDWRSEAMSQVLCHTRFWGTWHLCGPTCGSLPLLVGPTSASGPLLRCSDGGSQPTWQGLCPADKWPSPQVQLQPCPPLPPALGPTLPGALIKNQIVGSCSRTAASSTRGNLMLKFGGCERHGLGRKPLGAIFPLITTFHRTDMAQSLPFSSLQLKGF